MADTNFGALSDAQKTVWSRDVWKAARNASFIAQFTGKGPNSLIQRVTELTKTERGDKAVIQLIPDLTGDGTVGDYDLEGNEEAITNHAQTITIDQLRHANRSAGRMAEQKTVIRFREQSRDVLGYWLADRLDQMAFLTMAGVTYDTKNNGAARPGNATGYNLADLAYAADVTAPSANRHLRWDATAESLDAGDTSAVTATDRLSYKALVRAKAYAKEKYMRGVRGKGGEEMFHVFVTPQAMATLKLDPDFLANVRNAGVRGGSNILFAGSNSVMVDGMVIHEHRHVYNTTGLSDGSKWGSGLDVDGCRVAICGAQSLALADIGNPYWDEETFDYKNKPGISVGKIMGLLKPVFHSNVDGADEDFGILSLDVAL